MAKTTISINSKTLTPWREVAGVLGLSIEQFLERAIAYIGRYTAEREIMLEEQLRELHYSTRAEAQAVADRREEYAVQRQLDGDAGAHVVVAEPVQVGRDRWNVETSFLTSRGWVGRNDDWDDDDEEWKSAP